MNRKKKLNKILNSRIKKMNAKKAPSNKKSYVSIAEREKIAAAQVQDEQVTQQAAE